jgi:DNA-binding transcriptional regulator YiaG
VVSPVGDPTMVLPTNRSLGMQGSRQSYMRCKIDPVCIHTSPEEKPVCRETRAMRRPNPIRQAREDKHLQVGELAMLVGVSAVTIWRWERSRCQPTHAHTLALSRVLGTPAHVLVPRLVELLVEPIQGRETTRT